MATLDNHGKKWTVIEYDIALCTICLTKRRTNSDKIDENKKCGVQRSVWLRREDTPAVVQACQEHEKDAKADEKRMAKNRGHRQFIEDGIKTEVEKAHGETYAPRYVTKIFSRGSYSVTDPQPYTIEELEDGTVLCEYDCDEKPSGLDWVNHPKEPQETVKRGRTGQAFRRVFRASTA
jgi:hypothetical protein